MDDAIHPAPAVPEAVSLRTEPKRRRSATECFFLMLIGCRVLPAQTI